jgi:ABC-type multidrug transport system fused ATPase/permease subunit
MWQLLRERQGMLIIVALLVILTTILQVIGPYLLGIAIDQYILRGDLPGLAQMMIPICNLSTRRSDRQLSVWYSALPLFDQQ